MTRKKKPEILFEIDSAGQLRQRIEALTKPVPWRTEGRENDDTERYCLLMILRAEIEEWAFPLKIIDRERPDFEIHMSDCPIGLEMVEAVSQNEAATQAMRERGLGPEMHAIRRSAPGEPKLTAEELRAEIEADDMGGGWLGDSVEREWASATHHFIEKKIESGSKEGFQCFPKNWLAVYDNWSLPKAGFKLEKAMGYLRSKIDLNAFVSALDRLYILSDQQIIRVEKNFKWTVRTAGP